MSTVSLGREEGEDVTCLTGRQDSARWNMSPYSFSPPPSLTNTLADFLPMKAIRHVQSTLSIARNVKLQNHQHILTHWAQLVCSDCYRWYNLFDRLGQESVFSPKEPDSKYFRLCGLYGLCWQLLTSTVMAQKQLYTVCK